MNGRTTARTSYDMKYHPMDKFTRPKRAAKRRRIDADAPLSEDLTLSDTGEESEAMNVESDSSGDDIDEEILELATPQPPPERIAAGHRLRRTSAVGRPNYNMKQHPQDSQLRKVGLRVGIRRGSKRKRTSESADSPSVESERVTDHEPTVTVHSPILSDDISDSISAVDGLAPQVDDDGPPDFASLLDLVELDSDPALPDEIANTSDLDDVVGQSEEDDKPLRDGNRINALIASEELPKLSKPTKSRKSDFQIHEDPKSHLPTPVSSFQASVANTMDFPKENFHEESYSIDLISRSPAHGHDNTDHDVVLGDDDSQEAYATLQSQLNSSSSSRVNFADREEIEETQFLEGIPTQSPRLYTPERTMQSSENITIQQPGPRHDSPRHVGLEETKAPEDRLTDESLSVQKQTAAVEPKCDDDVSDDEQSQPSLSGISPSQAQILATQAIRITKEPTFEENAVALSEQIPQASFIFDPPKDHLLGGANAGLKVLPYRGVFNDLGSDTAGDETLPSAPRHDWPLGESPQARLSDGDASVRVTQAEDFRSSSPPALPSESHSLVDAIIEKLHLTDQIPTVYSDDFE